MRRGLLRRHPKYESGAGGGPALRTRLASLHWLAMIEVPRAARIGPPIVADGGMGALLASAVDAPALPGGGEPPRARERARRASRLHPRRRRADRDEHVRREPRRSSRSTSSRTSSRRSTNAGGQARARGARGVGPRRLHRRLDRAARRRRAARLEPARSTPSRRRPRGPRRRPLHARDVLRPRRPRDGVAAVRSVSSLPIVALMSFDCDRRDACRRLGRAGRRAAADARRRCVRREPWRRADRRASRPRRRCRSARRSPRCRTSGSRACPASGSSSRTRRPSTSASSQRRRARSAHESSAAAAARRLRRSPRSARRSTRTPSRPSPLLVREREQATPAVEGDAPTQAPADARATARSSCPYSSIRRSAQTRRR